MVEIRATCSYQDSPTPSWIDRDGVCNRTLTLPRHLRVAVNLLGWDRPVTGVERFARELTPHLLRCEPPGARVEFIVDAEATHESSRDLPELLESRVTSLRIPGGGRAGRHLTTQALVPRFLARRHIDVLFSPMNVGPIAWRRHVVMVHDLAWRHFPSAYTRSYRVLHRGLALGFRGSGATIACGSAAMQAELRSLFPKNSIQIIPYGPGRSRSSPPVPEDVVDDRVLWVGSHDARKDLATAVLACGIAAATLGHPIQLVVAGRRSPALSELSAVPHPPAVSLQYVEPTDAALEELYATSRVLLCSSLYEGYGFPVAEALARGLPVISSPVPSAVDAEKRGVEIVVVRNHTPHEFGRALAMALASDRRRQSPDPGLSWEASAIAAWEILSSVPSGTKH